MERKVCLNPILLTCCAVLFEKIANSQSSSPASQLSVENQPAGSYPSGWGDETQSPHSGWYQNWYSFYGKYGRFVSLHRLKNAHHSNPNPMHSTASRLTDNANGCAYFVVGPIAEQCNRGKSTSVKCTSAFELQESSDSPCQLITKAYSNVGFVCKAAAYAPAGSYQTSTTPTRTKYGWVYPSELCPAGRYRSDTHHVRGPDSLYGTSQANINAQCTACPAGRYGVSQGETSNLCTELCDPGFYCLAGSTNARPSPCAAGYYGTTGGHQTSSCQGQCPSGYYCPSGTVTPSAKCKAGHWGGLGQTSETCNGPCTPGAFWVGKRERRLSCFR